MMDPQIKAEWVAALRSGDYEQGHGALHKVYPNGDEKFCCLGVLCTIMAPQLGLEVVRGTTEVRYAHDTDYLPPSLADAVGLDSRNPEVVVDGGPRATLADINDDDATFDLIANYIEEQL